jgi:DUF1365 family protein
MFMLYLDLDELPDLFDRFWLWSARRPAPAWFRRRDHFGDPGSPLAECVRGLVAEHTGRPPQGRIALLTHLRYFGYCFNPVSFYYCFDANRQLEDVVLEVNNTPWGERHCYVLPREHTIHRSDLMTAEFHKQFHVSPFLPMDMRYRCRLTEPGERLLVAIENWQSGHKVFDAHLDLQREPLTHRSLALRLTLDPVITARVMALIMWQAIRLARKRAPFFSHPANDSRRQASISRP